MSKRQISSLGTLLEEAVGQDRLTELGRSTGFMKRRRDVTAGRLGTALLEAMATCNVRTLADLQRHFRATTGRHVEYKPFHNQLAKPEFPVFMRAVFDCLMTRLATRTLAAVPGHVLRQFDDIYAHDGSSSPLHEELRGTYPGRFTNSNPAAVEIHVTLSVLEGRPLRVIVAADAKPERPFLPGPEELRRRLLLADRGYMDLGFCEAVAEAGGGFIIRFSKSISPTILGGTRSGRQIPRRTLGRSLKRVTHHLAGHDADLDVLFERGGKALPMRLVLLWNEHSRRHVLLATNLPRTDFLLGDIDRLYRLRWQIELLFKEWKSYANLKPFCTRKPGIAEGLIWAALSAALLKRFLAHVAQSVSSGVEISTQKAAMALSRHLRDLFDALLHARPVIRPLTALLEFLVRACRRAHPSRDRTSGRLSCGLRPAYLNSRLATCVAKD